MLHSFMALNRESHIPAGDMLSQTHMKNHHHFSRGDAVFLSGRNPYNALQFIYINNVFYRIFS